jgi:drug/metabolite transporter (DMT)-like permease
VFDASGVASAALGIASAASWGAGDFCGGLAAKRAASYQVVVGSQLIGVAVLLGLAVASGETPPPLANLLWCGAAGLSGAVGLLALYRALADGRMGLAAPVSGVLSAAVPVVAGSVVEGMPGPVTLIGFALALVAVWLIARTADTQGESGGLALPVAAGLGFGCFIVIIGRASGGAVYWPLVAARVASLSVMSTIAVAGRQALGLVRRALTPIALAGLFDAGGNAFLVMAAHAGRLDVAAVLSSLYPAATVLLAWQILKERITRWQLAGLLTALCAIVAITAR